MNHQPPRLARKIFKLLAGPAHIEDLLGDLEELFYLNVQTKSLRAAKLWYWRQVLSLSFSYALKKRKRSAQYSTYASSTISLDLMRNYVKIALRNLYQHKYFSVLNAFGLAMGMSISLLLIAIYSFVSTYDDFQVHKDHIYAITSTQTEGIDEALYAIAPAALADKLETEFTGVSNVVRIFRDLNTLVKTEKENLPIKTYYVQPDFFSVFTFNLEQGKASSLTQPNQIILTESAAQKIFNEDDVVGKTLELANGTSLIVAGLMQDIPNNTHMDFEALISYSTTSNQQLTYKDQWLEFAEHYVYVMLRDGTAVEDLQHYLNGVSAQAYMNFSKKINFEATPMLGIAMGKDIRFAIGAKWDLVSFMVFGLMAALILLPACFNYTNISIARALKRAKEIGLRKTMGGVNKQIFFQFTTETIIVTLFSLVGALLIFVLIRPEFQSMVVGGSRLDLSLTWNMVTLFLIFALATGFVAGIFPAIYFSALNPIEALKSKINAKGSSLRIRKGLTIFQFALSFGFILCLVVFYKQYRYSLDFNFGFEKENIVDVALQDVKQEQFRTAFSQLTPVRSISMSSGLLGVGGSPVWVQTEANDSTEAEQMFVDQHYINNFGLKIVAGGNFPDVPWQRERHVIVNEEFVRSYKIQNPADIVGKIFQIDGHDLEVLGVVKDFNYASLKYPIGKFLFRVNPSEFTYANMKVSSMDPFRLFSQFENTWKELPTQKKFIGNYFEDELSEAYQSYRGLLKMVGFMGVLALTISLLGMLGMVVYTAEMKTKEVGIRKVMGARVVGITYLLSKDYLKMMALAIVVAIPTTAFLLDQLLPGLQYYSVKLSVWDVVLSTSILLALGVITV
ncbi:MAG TPA: ABC transporter permease, partial [Chryseosolibacter sp.]|nr:ABC transporter permease [Chryseosolibacter sp.]